MYSDLVVTPSVVKAWDINITVKVTVENVGKLDGDEVCVSRPCYHNMDVRVVSNFLCLQVTQVYLSWTSPNAAGIAPIRQLVGAQRNFIKSQQSLPVRLAPIFVEHFIQTCVCDMC